MYNTNNSILVNGPDINLLVRDHLPAIMATMNIQSATLNEESKQLAEALKSLHRPHSIEAPRDKRFARSKCHCTAEEKKINCPSCNTHSCAEPIECDNCSNWFHYSCAGLNRDEIRKHEASSTLGFYCNSCTKPDHKRSDRD